MGTEALSNGETSASHEYVTVDSTYERKEGGFVGTVELSPTGRRPAVMVHVVNELPAGLPVEDVGFNSEAEPQAGSATSREVSIKQTVEDEPVRIEYGIKLAEPVEEVAFEPPTIEAVEAAELTRSSAARADGGEGPAAGTEGCGDDGSSGSFPSIMSLLGRDSPDPEPEDDPGSEAPEPDLPVDERPRSDEPGTDDQSDDAVGSTGTVDGTDTDPSDGGTEHVGEAGDGTTDAGDERVTPDEAAGGGEQFSWGVPTTDGGESRTEAESAPLPDPRSEPDRAPGTDRTGADTDRGTTRADRRSVEARVDQLTLRVEEFAAYATALEALIDEHGSATEFLDRTESELAELDERLGAVRQEVESVRADHGEGLDDLRDEVDALDERIASARNALEVEVDDVRDRVDAVDDEVGRVDDAVERLDADLLEQGSDVDRLEAEVETLDQRVAGIETEVQGVRETVHAVEEDVSAVSADVRAMREEMESLRAEVEAFNDVRRSLADAFDLPGEVESPDED